LKFLVDPIWTLETGSLFLLPVEMKDLFLGDGLIFTLHDYDSVGTDEVLGIVVLSPKQVYECTGQRIEYKLQPPPGHFEQVPGHLVIRCRRASNYDIHFMEDFEKVSKSDKEVGGMGSHKFDKLIQSKGGNGGLASIMNKRSRIAKHGRNVGKREVRRNDVFDFTLINVSML
jgi:hypothetical protein